MAKIYLDGMNFYAHHGCYEEERTIGTNFRVDMQVTYDSKAAEKSDDIADAVSYLELYAAVKEEMEHPSHILENVARRILDRIVAQFPVVSSATVKITKLAPPLGGDVREAAIELSL